MKKMTLVLALLVLILLTVVACNKKNSTKVDPDILTDIDGNTYQTIVIGNQRWMAENLKVTHYRDGSQIPNVTSDTAWGNLTTGAYCSHNNDDSNVPIYGYLYNWFALDDNRNIAPEGWRVPTDDDWKELELYLGMSPIQVDQTDYRGGDVGGKMKETGTELWGDPNVGATNESGFSALPGKYRHDNGSFYIGGALGFGLFWTSEPVTINSDLVSMRLLSGDEAMIYRHYRHKSCGLSVRLIKDD